jgi:hypothetical protein
MKKPKEETSKQTNTQKLVGNVTGIEWQIKNFVIPFSDLFTQHEIKR